MKSRLDTEKIDLSSAVPACKESDLNPHLVSLLKSAQALCGFQFLITSGFRSRSYELSKGRSGSSSHCKGLAVDIGVNDSYERYKVLLSLGFLGAPRLGVGKTFIHIDIDETKPNPIMWTYYASETSK